MNLQIMRKIDNVRDLVPWKHRDVWKSRAGNFSCVALWLNNFC